MEHIKELTAQLKQAIKDYKASPDYDSIELEIAIDDLLCKMPQDMVYLEWFDRSQIAEFMGDEYKDRIDECMFALWDNDESLMRGLDVQEIIHDRLGGNND